MDQKIMNHGIRLRSILDKIPLSQTEFAKIAGVKSPTVNGWLNKENFSNAIRLKVLKALKMTWSDFLDESVKSPIKKIVVKYLEGKEEARHRQEEENFYRDYLQTLLNHAKKAKNRFFMIEPVHRYLGIKSLEARKAYQKENIEYFIQFEQELKKIISQNRDFTYHRLIQFPLTDKQGEFLVKKEDLKDRDDFYRYLIKCLFLENYEHFLRCLTDKEIKNNFHLWFVPKTREWTSYVVDERYLITLYSKINYTPRATCIPDVLFVDDVQENPDLVPLIKDHLHILSQLTGAKGKEKGHRVKPDEFRRYTYELLKLQHDRHKLLLTQEDRVNDETGMEDALVATLLKAQLLYINRPPRSSPFKKEAELNSNDFWLDLESRWDDLKIPFAIRELVEASPDFRLERKSPTITHYGESYANFDFNGSDLRNKDYSGIRFSNGSFRNAKMHSAKFSDCKFFNVDFRNNDLRQVDFNGATFLKCKFVESNLTDIGMEGATMENVFFSDSQLDQIRLNKATLEKTDFSNASLGSSIFDEATISNSRFSFCKIEKASFVKAKIKVCFLDHSQDWNVEALTDCIVDAYTIGKADESDFNLAYDEIWPNTPGYKGSSG